MKRTIVVTVLCVAMMLMGAHARAQALQSRCAQIGQKWVDFWNSNVQDATAMFSDVFTDDIVYFDIPTSPTQPLAEGRDQLLAIVPFFAGFPNSRFELGRSACQGQQGFFEWTWSAEDGGGDKQGFCGTGKPFTLRGVAVVEIQGNRISRDADYSDSATIPKQLLMEDPNSRSCVAGLLGLSEE